MQHKKLIIAMALCCLVVPAAAETVPPGQSPARAAKDFATVKQQMLNRIDQRLLKLHAEQDCVKAAATMQELNACRPKKRRPHAQAQPAMAPPPAPPPPSAAPVTPPPAQ